MRKVILLLGLILFFYKESSAQVKPIYYTIGDDVAEKIDSLISSANEPIGSYYGIWDTEGEITSLMLARTSTMGKNATELLRNSNRFLRIKKDETLPIVLESDLMFSENLNIIESKGTKHESIRTITLTPSGFLIKFSGRYKNMKLLTFKYYQY